MSRTAMLSAGAILVASVAGVLDAARGDVWDLFVLFTVIFIAQVLAVITALTDRTWITVRPDLARWIGERSSANGEPVDDVIDRALAFYQHGLYRPAQYQPLNGDGD